MKSSCDDCGELLNSWDSGCRLVLCLFGRPSQFLTEKNSTRVLCSFQMLVSGIALGKSLCTGLTKTSVSKNLQPVCVLCVELLLSQSRGVKGLDSIGSERFIITAC